MSTLKWLRGLAPGTRQASVDHPVSSMEEARALLGQLPVGDPARCLAEATNWLASIALAEGFEPVLRARIVALIEDRAVPFEAEIVSEVFAAAGGATEGYAPVNEQQPVVEADAKKLRS